MAEKMKLDALENGTVNISDDVIGIITSLAVKEIEGIRGFHGGFADLVEKFGVKNLQKGVEVTLEEKDVFIKLHLVADYGTKIMDISVEAQNKVKNVVEEMTGLNVKKVDVFIDAINIPNKKIKDIEKDIEIEKNIETEQ